MVSLTLSACGGMADAHHAAHDDHGVEDPFAEASEYMADRLATTLTAGADEASTTNPSRDDWSHNRVKITRSAVDAAV